MKCIMNHKICLIAGYGLGRLVSYDQVSSRLFMLRMTLMSTMLAFQFILVPAFKRDSYSSCFI